MGHQTDITPTKMQKYLDAATSRSIKRTDPTLLRGKRRRDLVAIGDWDFSNYFDYKKKTSKMDLLRRYVYGSGFYHLYYDIHRPYQEALDFIPSYPVRHGELFIDIEKPIVRTKIPSYQKCMQNKFIKGSKQYRYLGKLMKNHSCRKRRLLKLDAHREKYISDI